MNKLKLAKKEVKRKICLGSELVVKKHGYKIKVE